jgi:ankyrin repeat protein
MKNTFTQSVCSSRRERILREKPILLIFLSSLNCQNDFTPLHHAAQNGLTEIVSLLIAKGAKIEAKAFSLIVLIKSGFKE